MMNKYESPELDIVQVTTCETIADEGDTSVIIFGDQLYPAIQG